MKGRVLLVEEDVLLARPLARLLGRSGYDVTHVSSCAAARGIGESFDVVIVDGELPDGDGIDLHCDLRELGIAPCAVFLTASRDTGFVLSADGPLRCVQKIEGAAPLIAAVAATLAEQAPVATAVGAERSRVREPQSHSR